MCITKSNFIKTGQMAVEISSFFIFFQDSDSHHVRFAGHIL